MIIGLGNPLHTDDAVGPHVARLVHELLDSTQIELCELAAGGIELLETIVGHRNAVIIDALYAEKEKPGTCYLLDLEHLPPTRHASMSHEFGLLEGLELGRRLGLDVPARIWIYAVTVSDPFTFGTRMTEEVAGAIPRIAREIAGEIRPHLIPAECALGKDHASQAASLPAISRTVECNPQSASGGLYEAANREPVRNT
jgi:hydrogenase maturation protease